MKERPIIFSGPMVRAILEEMKTQTRRVMIEKYVKLLPLLGPADLATHCPYGQVGDKLWVREKLEHSLKGTPTRYAADGCPVMREGASIDWPFKTSPLPSILMPRWASRILFEITEVRVQRVQEITPEDAVAEGAEHMPAANLREERLTVSQIVFAGFWDSMNAKRGYGWERNPWVWAITFKRVR